MSTTIAARKGTLYSVQQASVMLGSESKVYRLMRAGKLVSVFIDGRRMVTVESIRAYLRTTAS